MSVIQCFLVLVVVTAAQCAGPSNQSVTSSSNRIVMIKFDNTTCIVKNDYLYVNGESRGKLNETDIDELERYLNESDEWRKETSRTIFHEVEKIVKQLFDYQKNFWSGLFGFGTTRHIPTNATYVSVANSTMPEKTNVTELQLPEPPEFCLD